MKAIVTKYHGPTDFKGSRIIASDSAKCECCATSYGMKMIRHYWDFQRDYSRPLRSVFAILAQNGNILGWSVNRLQADKERDKYGDCHGDLIIVRMEPDGQP